MMHTVFVVEDDPAIRKLLSLAFRTNGWNVVDSNSVADAEQRIVKLSPSAIILDVTLGGDRDGNYLCRTWKAMPQLSGVPIVLLTARGQESDRAVGMRAGADAYINKPFRPAALLRLLERLIAAEIDPRARISLPGAPPSYVSDE